MAKLPTSSGGTGLSITDLAPVGQHVAVCLRVNDHFGVERPSFNNPQVKEIVDVTRFIFGLIGPDRRPYLVQTYEYAISGAPGANLMKFLTAWLGNTPTVGWDYCEMLGKGAMLTIQHKQPRKPGGTPYAQISGIAPVHPQLLAIVPQAAQLEPILQNLESRKGDQPAQSQRPPVAPPMAPPAAPPMAPPQAFAPPSPPPVAPPPPPVAPPAAPSSTGFPPPVAQTVYVSINGAVTEVPIEQLTTLPPETPAIRKGESTWSTAGALAKDEDVPF